MIRKLLMVSAALAMPIGLVVATGTTAYAKGKPPPDPAVNCSVHNGVVTFATPGLTQSGTLTTAKTTTSTTSGLTLENGTTSCTGSSGGRSIVSKTQKCSAAGSTTDYPICAGAPKGEDAYGSAKSFTDASNAANLAKQLKSLTVTANGITYTTKTTSVSQILGGACGSEAGFALNGTVKAPKNDKNQSAVATICLSSDTGSGTTGSFLNDLETELGSSPTSMQIATATMDPAKSTVAIGS
jgi:hypothetical protein